MIIRVSEVFRMCKGESAQGGSGQKSPVVSRGKALAGVWGVFVNECLNFDVLEKN